MKWILYGVLVAVAGLMCACSNSTFKISADIKGMGNQNIHIVFLGDSGVNDSFIPVNDGKFNVQGSSQELTVVSILDSQNKPLFRLAVKGGDKVEVTGDYNNPHHYQCKGSDVTQEWMKFETDNAMLYDQVDGTALDAAIEKYVAANKSSIVSALLLVFDYSDPYKAQKLLDGLDAEARPEHLMASLRQAQEAAGRPETVVRSLMLCTQDGDFEAFVPSMHKMSLLYWWSDNNQNRRDDIASIKQLVQQYGDRLTVADVSLASDTSAWRAIVKADSTRWHHYWAPGGIQDPAIDNLKIRTLPLCIVTDSAGNQLYRGSDISAAGKALAK